MLLTVRDTDNDSSENLLYGCLEYQPVLWYVAYFPWLQFYISMESSGEEMLRG